MLNNVEIKYDGVTINWNHQYSDLDALPLIEKYFLKQDFIASINVMILSPFVLFSCNTYINYNLNWYVNNEVLVP